jgi:hypothetical protein
VFKVIGENKIGFKQAKHSRVIVVVNVMLWSFTQFCENHGIQRQFTMTTTAQQNVVSK